MRNFSSFVQYPTSFERMRDNGSNAEYANKQRLYGISILLLLFNESRVHDGLEGVKHCSPSESRVMAEYSRWWRQTCRKGASSNACFFYANCNSGESVVFLPDFTWGEYRLTEDAEDTVYRIIKNRLQSDNREETHSGPSVVSTDDRLVCVKREEVVKDRAAVIAVAIDSNNPLID